MRLRSIRDGVHILSSGAMVLLLCASSPWSSVVFASSPSQSSVQIISPNCKVDWTNRTIDAMGIGFPPNESINARQAKEMTRRAAMGVGFRNLLECLQGVYVDSKTTIKNYMVANEEIRVKVSGMVQGAKIIKEVQLPDKSYEVTVRMNLAGGLNTTIRNKQDVHPVQKLQGMAIDTKKKKGQKGLRNYTGLVIDARGTGVEPALSPRILNEDGQEAYSVAYVKKQDLIDQGIAVYVPTFPAAKNHKRVTNNPLELKAIRATGKAHKTDLVIRNVDAQMLHVVPEHFEFLERAKVLIIYGDQ